VSDREYITPIIDGIINSCDLQSSQNVSDHEYITSIIDGNTNSHDSYNLARMWATVKYIIISQCFGIALIVGDVGLLFS